ncbi:MAG: hypothetical protein AABZ44_10580 [Elusimicrobiota bacterium]
MREQSASEMLFKTMIIVGFLVAMSMYSWGQTPQAIPASSPKASEAMVELMGRVDASKAKDKQIALRVGSKDQVVAAKAGSISGNSRLMACYPNNDGVLICEPPKPKDEKALRRLYFTVAAPKPNPKVLKKP